MILFLFPAQIRKQQTDVLKIIKIKIKPNLR